MPQFLGASWGEKPLSMVSDLTPSLQLRKPKCLEMSSAGGSLLGDKDVSDGANMSTSGMIDDGGRLQPRKQPSPLEKLLNYRRLRSQAQQNSDSSVAAGVSSDGISACQDARHSKLTSAVQPFLLTRLPKEIMEYVISLEDQNRQLRDKAAELYEKLQKEEANPSVVGCSYRGSADAFLGNRHTVTANGASGRGFCEAANSLQIGSDIAFTKEERERYINDVLMQVETIVQAHRNQSEAMILKYKQEADSAKLALKQLREAVELEGVDLSMLPAVLATMMGGRAQANCSNDEFFATCDGAKKTTDLTTCTHTGFDAVVAGIEKIINEKCAGVVDGAAEAMLEDLLRVEANDDVPAVVRESARRGFSVLAGHLATVVANYIGHFTEEVRSVRREREVACRELREELSMSENERLRITRRYEAEICALRDELHAFHVAAADGDELKATVHERAIRECSAMLLESRKEAEELREKLEEERSNNAATCLRLKASLQRHNAMFEAAVVQRAEGSVRQRDQRITELQQQIDKIRQEEAQRKDGRVSRAVQAQTEAVVLNESNYVANLLSLPSSWKGSSPVSNLRFASSPHSTCKSAAPLVPPLTEHVSDISIKAENQFEAEVWAKTMELLTKYGGVSQN